MVKSGRVDLYIEVDAVIDTLLIAKNFKDSIIQSETPLMSMETFIYVNEKHKELILKIYAAIKYGFDAGLLEKDLR